MALSATRLRDDLKSKIQALLDVKDSELLEDVCEAIANAVVDEVTGNAEVATTVNGVQTGSGSANGTGTVS